MRHEDIDQHDVEGRRVEGAHSCLTAVGDGDLESPALQTDLDGDAHHRVVIDHEYARHDDSFFLRGGGQGTHTSQQRLSRNADESSV